MRRDIPPRAGGAQQGALSRNIIPHPYDSRDPSRTQWQDGERLLSALEHAVGVVPAEATDGEDVVVVELEVSGLVAHEAATMPQRPGLEAEVGGLTDEPDGIGNQLGSLSVTRRIAQCWSPQPAFE
jgi:hypothetical protein